MMFLFQLNGSVFVGNGKRIGTLLNVSILCLLVPLCLKTSKTTTTCTRTNTYLITTAYFSTSTQILQNWCLEYCPSCNYQSLCVKLQQIKYSPIWQFTRTPWLDWLLLLVVADCYLLVFNYLTPMIQDSYCSYSVNWMC